jgi:flagellar basal body-associated protein FliL
VSTLTKTLTIVLTFASIFLCGVVAIYVANADNYRELYLTTQTRADSAQKKEQAAVDDLQQEKNKFAQLEAGLKQRIAALETKLTTAANELKTVSRDNKNLVNKVERYISTTESLAKTNDDLRGLLDKKLDELKDALARQTLQSKDLEETTAVLIAKMAIVDTLHAEKKRLEQEKFQLQAGLDKVLGQGGRETAPIPTVTPEVAIARPVPTIARPIGVKGSIIEIDLENKLVELSIGSAHGVREDMRFAVVRGQQYVCDILIVHVEPETAIGFLERLQPQLPPTVGDSVVTNL